MAMIMINFVGGISVKSRTADRHPSYANTNPNPS